MGLTECITNTVLNYTYGNLQTIYIYVHLKYQQQLGNLEITSNWKKDWATDVKET